MTEIKSIAREIFKRAITKGVEANVKDDGNKISFYLSGAVVDIDLSELRSVQTDISLPVHMANGGVHKICYASLKNNCDILQYSIAQIEKGLKEKSSSLIDSIKKYAKKNGIFSFDEYMDVKKLDALRKGLKSLIDNGWVAHPDILVSTPTEWPQRNFILEKNGKSILICQDSIAENFHVFYPSFDGKGNLYVSDVKCNYDSILRNYDSISRTVSNFGHHIAGHFFSFTGHNLSLEYGSPPGNIDTERYKAEFTDRLRELCEKHSKNMTRDGVAVGIWPVVSIKHHTDGNLYLDVNFNIVVNASMGYSVKISDTSFIERFCVAPGPDSADFLVREVEQVLSQIRLTKTSVKKIQDNTVGSSSFSIRFSDAFSGMDTSLFTVSFEGGKNFPFTKDGGGRLFPGFEQRFVFADHHSELDNIVEVDFRSPKGSNIISENSAIITLSGDPNNTMTGFHKFEEYMEDHKKMQVLLDIAKRM